MDVRKLVLGLTMLVLLLMLGAGAALTRADSPNSTGPEIYPGKCLVRVTFVYARGLPDACKAGAGGIAFCRKRAGRGGWEVATPLWCQE